MPSAKKPASRKFDYQHATSITDQEAAAIFEYHAWTPEQVECGTHVRKALQDAFTTVILFVPPSPDRSAALRKIREARMDANSAITHAGRY